MTDTTTTGPRRIVTGLDEQGRSCILIDGPVPRTERGNQLIWRAPALPADNGGGEDASVPFAMEHLKDGSATFSVTELPVGMGRFLHATDTLDYLVILKGTIVLEMEVGEATLRAGDCVVQRGTVHAWRNDGPDVATMASITLPALPVGKGATI
ncbi:cupin domain-containing protein [Sphingobium sufflavum]|uniref:cupin domain-containing protein n=1 Tax=Sphingobium sufflavum TaxID=1129547 RepID=UPI001F1C801F|nr:cupin domain-containing protein [Sphingobium sufflavum]MCE7795720.1 cupin domain-containing protein [Sphingobium sufflavum]